ncbi:dihydroxyacetone kinase subunit DhaL [Rubritalea profundi]|uniref:Dihydroxyacetone kinase subunit L n=1 Tax=Rubritalea profundi TaxID=1658618 RepID=A0A2S7U2M0_9BACT|nr:dihydroxyacetone kinase subunit DhaL [Rubritalea profundi]PQJ28860.1 dihydroxyacetone kinase subunit L [Rubritalea profundi]
MSFTPKLLNDPLSAADELLEGLVEAYNGQCYKVGARSIVKNDIPDGKVSLLVGGGAGHEPIYHAMVGTNMADGAACGDIFAAPAPNIVQEATTAIDRGNGVLYLYGNYAGDVMNFDVGAEMSAAADVDVQTVLIADDVASAPPERKKDRRGVAGLVPIVKIAGAASQIAETLEDLAAVTEKASLQTRSIGAAMAPGSIPATGKPTFELEPGMVGLGMGIHGEAGVGEIPLPSADELTVKMLDLLIADYEKDADVAALKSGDEIVFLINSLGATTMMECLVCMRKAAEYFEERGIEIFDVLIGPYVTCQEMAGISFSITRVDEELKQLWSMPCQSFCYSKMEGPIKGGTATLTKTASSSKTVAKKAAEKKQDNSKSTVGLSLEQTKQMSLLVAEKIIAAEPLLSQADRDLGDGDHGLGMARGFTALTKELTENPHDNLRDLYQAAGNALLTTMGGASGVVFGSLFLAGGKTMHGAEFFGSHELSHLLSQSLKDVMSRGGAKPGDKTMIDALHPAAEAAKANIDKPLAESIKAVAAAAEDGKEASKAMIATMGRAKTLGEKTIGLPDAGAISVTIILSTMADFINA